MLSASRRRGLSLVEILVVLTVLGVAASAIARLAIHQQRSFRLLATRSVAVGQLRAGSEILAADLAAIAPAAGDIYEGEMHASSIAFRAALGTYMLCGAPVNGDGAVDVVAIGPASGAGEVNRASISTTKAPEPGDSVWLYDPGDVMESSDDRWRSHVVTTTARAQAACGVGADTGAAPVTRLVVTPQPSSSLARHAPVRVFRRARYALYRSRDGAWYLGFADCRPLIRTPACAPLQPVSGPYLPPAVPRAGAPGGLALTYLDRDGAPTDEPLRVAAIDITLRAGTIDRGSPDTLSVRRVIVLRNATP